MYNCLNVHSYMCTSMGEPSGVLYSGDGGRGALPGESGCLSGEGGIETKRFAWGCRQRQLR